MKRTKFQHDLPGGYFLLYHRIIDSPIYNCLSVYSQVIYIKALSKANRSGKFDNLFTLTPSDFKNGSIKRRTFWRSIKELIEKGLVIKEENGGLFRNANKYRIVSLRNIYLNNLYKHWGVDTPGK